MIKRFEKNTGQFYVNDVEKAFALLLNELLEFMSVFGAYDKINDAIDYRKVLYIFIALGVIAFLCSILTITCVSILMYLG